MGDTPQMSMKVYLMISMENTPFKTMRKVLNLSDISHYLQVQVGIQYQAWNGSRWQNQDPHNCELPDWHGIDNLQVKVDNCAEEANSLPLDSFKTMCPHALDEHSYPTAGFLERSKINLECYNDRKLKYHGCIKLRLSTIQVSHFKTIIFTF